MNTVILIIAICAVVSYGIYKSIDWMFHVKTFNITKDGVPYKIEVRQNSWTYFTFRVNKVDTHYVVYSCKEFTVEWLERNLPIAIHAYHKVLKDREQMKQWKGELK